MAKGIDKDLVGDDTEIARGGENGNISADPHNTISPKRPEGWDISRSWEHMITPR